MSITWETPPPSRAGRPAQYKHIFRTLAEHPGEWARVKIPVKDSHLSSFANNVNGGRVKGSEPKGTYEACTRTVDGKTSLYIRRAPEPLDVGTDTE